MKLMDATLDGTTKALVTTGAPTGSDGALNVVLSPNSGLATLTTKAASTPPVAADVALVVTISPNTPSTATGTVVDGAVVPVSGSTGVLQMAVASDTPEQRLAGYAYPLSVTADGRLRVASLDSVANHNYWNDELDFPIGIDFWDQRELTFQIA